MASRTHKPKAAPDGAKPGDSEPDPAAGHAFNADERAKAREAAPITIGDKDFFRGRLNWTANRKVEEFGDAQVKLSRRQQRNGALMDELEDQLIGVRDPETGEWRTPPTTDDAKADELEKKIEDLRDKNRAMSAEINEAAYGILIARLRDGDGKPPTIAFLKEHLDLTEVGELARKLSGAEAPEGPTPTPDSSN